MSTPISRKTFLAGMVGCGLAAATGKIYLEWTHSQLNFPCRLLGPSRELGHQLRGASVAVPADTSPLPKTKVAIVGGGIAGLSAGWWLKRNGMEDFVLLELEKDVGGNSASGANAYSAYPWGAHYVPVCNPESDYVRTLFKELRIITGYQGEQPIYDDLYLCHEPQERLFKDGRFQEGLVPKRGLQKNDDAEIGRFFAQMVKFRHATGKDGKLAFAIPLDLSSHDPQFTDLDKQSMSAWMDAQGFHCKPLLWYVDYCCRDDYGSLSTNVSAWAGIHYFAGRRGTAANAELNSVVTWPEGNGFLVSRLRDILGNRIKPNALVQQIQVDNGKCQAVFLDPVEKRWFTLESVYTIAACPRFVARHIVKGMDQPHQELAYAPWMVANISLARMPDARGVPLAWDNVSYYSSSLGYVTANHQNINTRELPLVLTYYYPLSQSEPHAARERLYTASVEGWCKDIVTDLESMHPGIKDDILSIDLWPWGHGMIRPSVGSLWSGQREEMKKPFGNLYFAHSDMSGMSNFEEAQYHGVEAAKEILARLKQS